MRRGRHPRRRQKVGSARRGVGSTAGATFEAPADGSAGPLVGDVRDAWRQALQIQVGHVAGRLGSDDPETDAEIILSVIAGLEIDHLSTPLDPSTMRAIRTALRRTITKFGLNGDAGRR